MRILLANEAVKAPEALKRISYRSSVISRRAATPLRSYLPIPPPAGRHIVTADSWSIADVGLDRAIADVAGWRPDVCFSHNMRLLDVDERLCAGWPTFKMMHGYFGTCLSGHKAFAFPGLEPCTRVCGPACLVYYLPRHCGNLRPAVMATQYAWARRQQGLFGQYSGIVVASDHMRRDISGTTSGSSACTPSRSARNGARSRPRRAHRWWTFSSSAG
jgi:hypothetical protein